MSCRILAATLSAILAADAVAAPMDERTAAFEILVQRSAVERKLSNCRWIRGVRDDALSARWRRDNSVLADAAAAVVDSQGGLTKARGETVDGLAEVTLGEQPLSKEACRAFLSAVRSGSQDLSSLLPQHIVRQVLSYVPPRGEPLTWAIEQRRLPTGVLAYSARRHAGGLAECEAEAASRPHIFLRHQTSADGTPVPDADPDLWYAECLTSPVDPLTGSPVVPDAPPG